MGRPLPQPGMGNGISFLHEGSGVGTGTVEGDELTVTHPGVVSFRGPCPTGPTVVYRRIVDRS